ncbi:hypothetical protein V8E53_011313 [Lactarius tabidus]
MQYRYNFSASQLVAAKKLCIMTYMCYDDMHYEKFYCIMQTAMLGLGVAMVALFHDLFSSEGTWRPDASLPSSICTRLPSLPTANHQQYCHHFPFLPNLAESPFALFLGIIGAVLHPLLSGSCGPVRWRQGCGFSTIDNMGVRLEFAHVVTRARVLKQNRINRDLASAVGEFAQAVSNRAASDLGKFLSHSLQALAELERKAQETVSAQARTDQASLQNLADEYARLINSVRAGRRALKAKQSFDYVLRLVNGRRLAPTWLSSASKISRRAGATSGLT